MARSRCKTPGAIYQIETRGASVLAKVTLPAGIRIRDARMIRARMHKALESALSVLFVGRL